MNENRKAEIFKELGDLFLELSEMIERDALWKDEYEEYDQD